MDPEEIRPQITALVSTPEYGKFSVEPMERGFATTVGNALRRVLLSSVEGAAITSVKIRGVLHEFSTIPGVKEDATELLLNLKELAIRVRRDGGPVDKPIVLHISRRGAGEVTGADVETPQGVEVVNPEVHIATLDDDNAELSMEMTVEIGKGFVLPETLESYKHFIGTIPIGAAFTPVRKVNYTTEPTRRGSRIDLERLVMEIWTNGTVSPREALGQAARILVKDYLNLFLEFGLGEAGGEGGGEADILVETLGFSSRVRNGLKRANVLTLRDLLAKTEDDLLKIRNFGLKALIEVREKLSELGYELERAKTIPEEVEEAEEEQPEQEPVSEDKDGED